MAGGLFVGNDAVRRGNKEFIFLYVERRHWQTDLFRLGVTGGVDHLAKGAVNF